MAHKTKISLLTSIKKIKPGFSELTCPVWA